MSVPALWPAFRRILVAIGRWLLGVVRRRGIPILVGYMLERIEVFRARLRRAKTDRRMKWLRGRIRRWTAAAKWLTAHASDLHERALEQYEKLSARIPEVAPGERMAA
jgi:hypothetical protein